MANLGEPTKFITIEFEDKIDVRMDINIVKDELRDHKDASKVYERLAEVSKLSLSGAIQDKDPKEILRATCSEGTVAILATYRQRRRNLVRI